MLSYVCAHNHLPFLIIQVLRRLTYSESLFLSFLFLLWATMHMMEVKSNLQLTLPLRCSHGEVKPNSHWDPLLDGFLQAQHLPTRITFFFFFLSH